MYIYIYMLIFNERILAREVDELRDDVARRGRRGPGYTGYLD